MKITPTIATFAPTEPPEYKMEAVPVRPAIAVKLEDFLKQNPPQFLFAGPLSRAAAANTGFKLGAPLTLGPNLKFRSYPGFSAAAIGPISGSTAAASATIPASITKVTQAAALADAFRGPLEQWAKTRPGLDTPLDILGVVVATPQVWNAMIKPGPKDKIEVFLAVGQAGVWIAKVVADFVPGFQHTKPVLVWTGVVLKLGEQVYAIIHKPEAPGKTPQTAALDRNRLATLAAKPISPGKLRAQNYVRAPLPRAGPTKTERH